MRKIATTLTMDPETFAPKFVISVKHPDGTIDKTKLDIKADESKYTPQQQAKINAVNKALKDKNDPEMTEEEIEYMLKIGKYKLEDDLPEDTDEIQALAGFKVEKKIIYTDKHE